MTTKMNKEQKVVFVLSGSVFASKIDFSQNHLPCEIEVVGRSGENFGNVRFCGKEKDNTPHLLRADILVINGGFSAVSEALALGKETFIIPVPNHAEQYLNARLLSRYGRGTITEEGLVIEELRKILEGEKPLCPAESSGSVNAEGAREAAEIIFSIIPRPAEVQEVLVENP